MGHHIIISQGGHNNHSLNGAVFVGVHQNEAEENFQMDIYHHLSLTEKAEAMTLIELPQS